MNQQTATCGQISGSSGQGYCEPDSPPQTTAEATQAKAGLHPADLDNMLSLFPEMAERILKAARASATKAEEAGPQ